MIDFPNSPTTGQIYNSGTGPIYIWDGVAWSLVTQATRTARQNNLIVNPAMAVSQENGATAVTVTNAYPVDQWFQSFGGPVSSAQQVVSLTPDLSVNRIRKTITTPKASLAVGDYSCIAQPIEGTRLVGLAYGTAAAIQTVLRFGWKAPAGTYSFVVRTGNTPFRSYIKNFTISAAQANTDTLQVFTIPGDVTGTWVTDSTAGMNIFFTDGIGTNNQGVEGWQAGNFLGTAANSNMVATNGNVVELFDVGLYPDPEKTGLPPPFIAPIYSDALVTCQRYCEITGMTVSTPGDYTNTTWYSVEKRVNPTLTVISGNINGATLSGIAAAATHGFRQNTPASAASDIGVKILARM